MSRSRPDVEIYTIRTRFPFKVKETVKLVFRLLPTREEMTVIILFAPTTLLKDSFDQLRVISRSYYEPQRIWFFYFITILWNFWIFSQSFFSRLQELFMLKCRIFKWINQFLRWKIFNLSRLLLWVSGIPRLFVSTICIFIFIILFFFLLFFAIFSRVNALLREKWFVFYLLFINRSSNFLTT